VFRQFDVQQGDLLGVSFGAIVRITGRFSNMELRRDSWMYRASD